MTLIPASKDKRRRCSCLLALRTRLIPGEAKEEMLRTLAQPTLYSCSDVYWGLALTIGDARALCSTDTLKGVAVTIDLVVELLEVPETQGHA